jgi:hypothetical protein
VRRRRLGTPAMVLVVGVGAKDKIETNSKWVKLRVRESIPHDNNTVL